MSTSFTLSSGTFRAKYSGTYLFLFESFVFPNDKKCKVIVKPDNEKFQLSQHNSSTLIVSGLIGSRFVYNRKPGHIFRNCDGSYPLPPRPPFHRFDGYGNLL
jgi:hypothetical protein